MLIGKKSEVVDYNPEYAKEHNEVWWDYLNDYNELFSRECSQ